MRAPKCKCGKSDTRITVYRSHQYAPPTFQVVCSNCHTAGPLRKSEHDAVLMFKQKSIGIYVK